MNETTNLDNTPELATDCIREAQTLLKQDRSKGLSALNDLFRSGKPPEPVLNGPYNGELICLDMGPGVTQFFELVTSLWMPWQGKHMNLEVSTGDNIIRRRSRWFFYVFYPFYKGIIENGNEPFRAFVFKTSVGAGKQDTDIQVFKLDYASDKNPALTIRPILDEVTQVDNGVYLGKIHFKWFSKWKMIGYFSLRSPT